MESKLQLPNYLHHLIDSGMWPPSNLKDVASSEIFNELLPEEQDLYFCNPPFFTVFEEMQSNSAFWNEYGSLKQIDPKCSLLIGDFGLGTDTAIILDYRYNNIEPRVLRLVLKAKKRTFFAWLFSRR